MSKKKVFKKQCFKKDGNQGISGWMSLQTKTFITTWRTGIRKVFTTLYNGYKYTDTLMTLKFLSLFNLSPPLQTSESNCLIDNDYIWISNRHFRTGISKYSFLYMSLQMGSLPKNIIRVNGTSVYPNINA